MIKTFTAKGAYVADVRRTYSVKLVRVVGNAECMTCSNGFPGGFALEFVDGVNTFMCLNCSHDAALQGGIVAI